MARIELEYAEIGISTGKDAPDKLIYDGLMCHLIDFDDDCECVTYDNLEPDEADFEGVVTDIVNDIKLLDELKHSADYKPCDCGDCDECEVAHSNSVPDPTPEEDFETVEYPAVVGWEDED